VTKNTVLMQKITKDYGLHVLKWSLGIVVKQTKAGV
jgi:hypothetical protein